jgi:hypothetical protein
MGGARIAPVSTCNRARRGRRTRSFFATNGRSRRIARWVALIALAAAGVEIGAGVSPAGRVASPERLHTARTIGLQIVVDDSGVGSRK